MAEHCSPPEGGPQGVGYSLSPCVPSSLCAELPVCGPSIQLAAWTKRGPGAMGALVAGGARLGSRGSQLGQRVRGMGPQVGSVGLRWRSSQALWSSFEGIQVDGR